MEQKPQDHAKKAAAEVAATFVKDGMTIGLGTGSTVYWFIRKLGELSQQGLQIQALATSYQSQHLAKEAGIALIDNNLIQRIDLTIDGADEIDGHKRMIKGGGGALLREKVVASISHEVVIIIDSTKLVNRLGKFPVPVEILAFAYQGIIFSLNEKGYHGFLRLTKEKEPYVTDNGNFIYDIQFDAASFDPEREESELKRIPGVLETGIFCGLAGKVIVGNQDGTTRVLI